ncbi:membrane protein DedA with SNARE-associated domain [Microbacterium endophyticum]|uniref:Membrane protein DedA with SNARE-associated domain n=1 Tax=Microbacterium endophyticum TaxID=1526412 RepID=A0A7W4YMB7_9MICO|nr:DedA family protein [Microbacterium endophyticum]MBB2976043.1 membrane protein DedA with SNARE-associated domain [Microbacterium endophyticum]NIK35038.1 membrane protein DedA with SNARE-associated domain [Microbacterium endophyticum]
MAEQLATFLSTSPLGLVVLAVLVFGDAFFVILPGEAAVTAFGALAVSTGSPPLILVISISGMAAFAGDACCYAVGRRVGLTRWRWMRRPRLQKAFALAHNRLQRSTGTVVFTARFIPFARLAVNLTAGATRTGAARYLTLASLAALGWAAYQAVIGAIVASLIPGGPFVAVLVSIAVALSIGFIIDALVARRSPRAHSAREG